MPERHVRAIGAVFAALLGLAVVGCGDDASPARSKAPVDAGTPRDAGPRVKPRSVRVEVLSTVERALEQADDGSLRYGALTPIDGVEICAVKRRPAFSSFEPFEDFDKKLCVTSAKDHTVWMEGLPVDSDLILTATKDGYQTSTMTFRTNESDTATPLRWNEAVRWTMLRKGAITPFLEKTPAPRAGNGWLLSFASAVWEGFPPTPPDLPRLVQEPTAGLDPAEGIDVELTEPGASVKASFTTRRDRPVFVSLPPGEYRLRFTHDRFKIRPVDPEDLYLPVGLTTDIQDAIEVPVLGEQLASGVVDALCDTPLYGEPIGELATCTPQFADDGGP